MNTKAILAREAREQLRRAVQAGVRAFVQRLAEVRKERANRDR